MTASEAQVLTARCGLQSVKFYTPTLDAAVSFGEWLVSRGYEVDIRERTSADMPRTPREEQEASRLERLYACSLPK